MNGNYIYHIFETCEKNKMPDLTIALAYLKSEQPIPQGCTELEINRFIGRHYQDLVEAYKAHNRDFFAGAVAALAAADARAEEDEGEK